nr:hypothetical protein [Tanacetum cinerariifolium]GFA28830.1 hypothetical protein [Tanacetum cinerariifolium]GFA29273.1 hypothetical protein [Tanacetum cinerariifolium]
MRDGDADEDEDEDEKNNEITQERLQGGHVVAAMAGFRYPFHSRRPEPFYNRVLPLIADVEGI